MTHSKNKITDINMELILVKKYSFQIVDMNEKK